MPVFASPPRVQGRLPHPVEATRLSRRKRGTKHLFIVTLERKVTATALIWASNRPEALRGALQNDEGETESIEVEDVYGDEESLYLPEDGQAYGWASVQIKEADKDTFEAYE